MLKECLQKIIGIEEYEEVDPQCPGGGPEGTKDILCLKEGNVFVVASYFPSGQKPFSDIKEKFESDFKGVEKNNADGFVFITNQKITPSERIDLCSGRNVETRVYHGERVVGILDSPKAYGVRLEYLGIELSKAEQISFLNAHLDLKEQFYEIKKILDKLNVATNRLVGEIHERDVSRPRLFSTLPLSGINFSSRISIEDLLSLHRACIYESQVHLHSDFLGFRKIDVWIGNAGKDRESSDFVPPPAQQVPGLTLELLEWWRIVYMKVIYNSMKEKIFAIAQFHENFLTIHPFLDGNGRTVRVLSSIQFKDLMNKDVYFEKVDRITYYKALQNARNGNGQELTDIFMALIKE